LVIQKSFIHLILLKLCEILLSMLHFFSSFHCQLESVEHNLSRGFLNNRNICLRSEEKQHTYICILHLLMQEVGVKGKVVGGGRIISKRIG
jgi:hypothetical protein